LENYIYYGLSEKSDIFDDNFEENKLYFFTGDINYYSYITGQAQTYFARYLSFAEVVE
jgi:hypothetical protein